MVKVAVTLLGGRALTWWRAVNSEGWATLGLCDWQTFSTRISQAFRDLHHDFRNQTKLLDLRQRTSVSKYNDEFRSLMMEVRQVMSLADGMGLSLLYSKSQCSKHHKLGSKQLPDRRAP